MSLLIDFVLPALLVSGSALAALRLSPAAPPGLRFTLALTGLLAWLVPWPSIGWPVASAIAPGVEWAGEGATPLAAIREGLVATAETAVPSILSPSPWWLVVFLPGLCRFAGDLWVHGRTVRRWRRISRPGHALAQFLPTGFGVAQIRVVPDSSIVVVAGVLRPTIFIGDRIVDDDALRTALTHEACHARRYDPLWLMLVTLIGRIYWFNPFVSLLKRHAILAIEAGCDEVCARRLGRGQYRRTLARLVLEGAGRRDPALMPSLHTPGLNLTRLKLLGSGSRVDIRARSAVVLVLAAGIGGVSWGSTGSMRLWLGDWIEVANPARWGYDSAPLSRRFEQAADGMTRLYAAGGVPGDSAEFRCDGRPYPAQHGINGVRPRSGWVRPPSGSTLVCNAVDRRTHDYVVGPADGSGAIAYVTETISPDGETMELAIRQVSDGRERSTTRTLSRLR